MFIPLFYHHFITEKIMLPNQPSQSSPLQKPRVYTPPAIIYQGQISSRAGSPSGPIAPTDERDTDPIDLFEDKDGA
jgi:hypothetical protein